MIGLLQSYLELGEYTLDFVVVFLGVSLVLPEVVNGAAMRILC